MALVTIPSLHQIRIRHQGIDIDIACVAVLYTGNNTTAPSGQVHAEQLNGGRMPLHADSRRDTTHDL